MASFSAASFRLDVTPAGVAIEVINERNHSAGLEAGCTLDEFLEGTFHGEVRQYLGADVLETALREARTLRR